MEWRIQIPFRSRAVLSGGPQRLIAHRNLKYSKIRANELAGLASRLFHHGVIEESQAVSFGERGGWIDQGDATAAAAAAAALMASVPSTRPVFACVFKCAHVRVSMCGLVRGVVR